MKKVALILSIFCLINLAGCTKAETKPENIVTLPEDIGTAQRYSRYTTDSHAEEFEKFIKENKIDADYNEEYSNKDTIRDEVIFQNKYFYFWEIELSYSIKMLKKDLSKEDGEKLSASNDKWLADIKDNFDLENDIFFSGNYNIPISDKYAYELASAKREAYRDRTIQIKYLHYLIELSNPELVSDGVFEALKFDYKAK